MNESSARIGFGGAIGIVIAAIAGVAIFQWVQSRAVHRPVATETQAASKEDEPAPPKTSSKVTPTLRKSCAFKVGDRFGFDITERRDWLIDLGQDVRSPLPANLGSVAVTTRSAGTALLRWRLDMRAVKRVEERATIFVATVSRPTATVQGEPRTLGPAQLTAPMLLRIGRRCDVLSMARAASLDTRAARAQQVLIRNLSYRLPATDGERRYTEAERDGVGVHEAEYKVQLERAARLRRTPLGTFELYMFDGRVGSVTVRSAGTETIVPGDRGWFASFESDVRRTFVDFTTYATTRTQLSAKPIAAQAIALQVKDTNENWVWGDLLAVRSAALDSNRDGSITGLMGMPLGTLRRMLHEQLSDAALDPTIAVDLARDWLRANPDLITELVEALRSRQGGALEPTLLLALRLTNNEAHVRVLSGLMIDVSQPVPVRVGAMLALAGSPLLDNGVIDKLRRLSLSGAGAASNDGKVARAAAAVIGHIARLQRVHNPELASRVGNILRDHLNSAAHNGQMIAQLAGVSNAGDDTLAELLVGRHQSEDPQVRSAVARATAKMHPGSASAVLDEWIGTEPDASVRTAIAEATAVQIALRADDHAALRKIRGPAIIMLGQALQAGQPWARQALKARAAAERTAESPNPGILGEVQALLQRYPAPQP